MLVWNYTKNYTFSVKSADHIHQTLLTRNDGAQSSGSASSNLWSNLWKLNTTNGVKMFVSRACNNILPTLANLKSRNTVQEDACPICCRYSKTSGHAL